jgi:Ca2+/Na+ antiporter
MNWLKQKWALSVAYWAVIVGLMLADGSLGWDDVVLFFAALYGYFKLFFKASNKAR